MGRDGADGLLAIRRKGGYTIAQDEETSIVFGMPGEAVKIGAAISILPIEKIGDYLNRIFLGLPEET
jgi:two-component system chemotaxis response regulator CheB